jgi:hypothetical protein
MLSLARALVLAVMVTGAAGDIFSAVSMDSQAEIKKALAAGEDINQRQSGRMRWAFSRFGVRSNPRFAHRRLGADTIDERGAIR